MLRTGASVALRDVAERTATRVAPAVFASTLTVIVYVALILLIIELVPMPISFYSGYLLERRYELSNESLRVWLADQVKSLAIGIVLFSVAASVLYALIRRSPDGWWLGAGLVFALFIVAGPALPPRVPLPSASDGSPP